MRSIPTSVMCNFWLFFAALAMINLLLLVLVQLPLIPQSPLLVISSIVMTSVLMGVVIFQDLGLYLICKRGVPKEQEQGFAEEKDLEGFRHRR